MKHQLLHFIVRSMFHLEAPHRFTWELSESIWSRQLSESMGEVRWQPQSQVLGVRLQTLRKKLKPTGLGLCRIMANHADYVCQTCTFVGITPCAK